MVHGLFVLGVGSALCLELLDIGAVTQVTILLATTIALIPPFFGYGPRVFWRRVRGPGALRLVINIVVAETESITLAASLAVIGFMGILIFAWSGCLGDLACGACGTGNGDSCNCRIPST